MATSRIAATVLVSLMCWGLACDKNERLQASRSGGTNDEKVTIVNTINTNPVLEPVSDIRLEAKISTDEQAITIKYSVTNTSAHDIYVLDAYPAVDPQNRTASADLKSFYLSFREPATALVLKGNPPLPDRPVTVRVMPLGTKLAVNAKVQRELTLPLPLRERSDWYYPPLPPEEYSIGSIDKISFNVQFMRSTVEGFAAVPAHYATDFFVVTGTNTVKQAETLNQEFTIGKTQLFIRRDRFNRL